jgi:hypothetical protein
MMLVSPAARFDKIRWVLKLWLLQPQKHYFTLMNWLQPETSTEPHQPERFMKPSAQLSKGQFIISVFTMNKCSLEYYNHGFDLHLMIQKLLNLIARSSWPEDLSCHFYQHDDKSKSKVITLVVPAKDNKSTVISWSPFCSIFDCHSCQTWQV